jgi:hypothetical protein
MLAHHLEAALQSVHSSYVEVCSIIVLRLLINQPFFGALHVLVILCCF